MEESEFFIILSRNYLKYPAFKIILFRQYILTAVTVFLINTIQNLKKMFFKNKDFVI